MEQLNNHMLADNVETAALTATVHTEVYASTRSYLADALKMDAEAIDLDTVLADIGADSISLPKFVFHLEQRYRISIPPEFTILSTFAVRDVVDVVTRQVVAARLQPS
jgi:acyl carrier protein